MLVASKQHRDAREAESSRSLRAAELQRWDGARLQTDPTTATGQQNKPDHLAGAPRGTDPSLRPHANPIGEPARAPIAHRQRAG